MANRSNGRALLTQKSARRERGEASATPPPTRALRCTLLLTVLASARGFVLSPSNVTLSSGLPGSSYRWTTPSSLSSSDGLGKGLAYVLDPSFCDQMVPLFPENEGMLGLVQFVDCSELKAAIGRAMSTWSANHQLITFTDISDTATCVDQISGALTDTCPWEMFFTSASGDANSGLAAFVVNARASSFDTTPPWYQQNVRSPAGVLFTQVDQMRRSNLTLQRHICWYLDPTFCASMSGMGDGGKVFLRLVLFTAFAFALIRIFVLLVYVALCLCCVRTSDGDLDSPSKLKCEPSPVSWGYSACADYIAQLSPCGLFLTVVCAVFPLIFYDRIYLPCEECYDFESVVAHEIGHVLGFGHPDEYPSNNLGAKASCLINNATCRDPFSCAELSAYPSDRVNSIMHSISRVAPETCLFQQDLEGLHMLYPVCDDLMPPAPLCNKSIQLSGWLRLAIVTGFPVGLALLLIVVPITCFHNRDRRMIQRLSDEVDILSEDPQQEQLQKIRKMLSRHRLMSGIAPRKRGKASVRDAMKRSMNRLPIRSVDDVAMSPRTGTSHGAAGAEPTDKSSQVFPVTNVSDQDDLSVEDVDPGLTLEQVFDDDEARAVFQNFLQKEQAEDLLLFWQEVHAFHGRWEGYGSGEKADALRENDADEVIAAYLNDGSSHQVCAGDARVKALIDGTYTRKDMFDELQADVYAKLNNEVFPRFLNSSEGGHLVKRKQ
ncbi:hypothetical protein AB1Y20_009988 [Prymnesium parvum]|uniref:RGS domain-containing protein n=1 Tax=Prymnesium parvum TaxID=97485 RepID=A0AB34K3N5_PRYPA